MALDMFPENFSTTDSKEISTKDALLARVRKLRNIQEAANQLFGMFEIDDDFADEVVGCANGLSGVLAAVTDRIDGLSSYAKALPDIFPDNAQESQVGLTVKNMVALDIQTLQALQEGAHTLFGAIDINEDVSDEAYHIAVSLRGVLSAISEQLEFMEDFAKTLPAVFVCMMAAQPEEAKA